MEKYKLGRYVHLYQAKGGYILFNLINDKTLLLENDLAQLLEDLDTQFERLASLHPSLFSTLQADKFIVPIEEDEVLNLIENWRKEDLSEHKYTVTVNPTLGCNLRCWYCYEEHEGRGIMKDEILDRLRLLIKQKIESPKLRGFNLDFFGGEPLLAFDKIVKVLIDFTKEECDKHQKQYYFSFTTNAVLLDETVTDYLKTCGKYAPVRLQITLDGDEGVHDATRFTKGGKPTYRTIVHNIKYALTSGLDVLVRFNYTEKNAPSFRNVLSEFLPLDRDLLLAFSFNRVWQEQEKEDVEQLIESIKNEYIEAGFNVECVPLLRGVRCYADKENFIVVNYDGNVYKCTAREFCPDNAEGVLTKEGKIEWNERFYRRMGNKFGNSICKSCEIYPICHGGCSQQIAEHEAMDGCIKGYDAEKREDLIRQRLYCLLRENGKKTKSQS